MPRKRIDQSKSGKAWGTQNGTQVTRRRKDGTTYTEYRHPYYANVPILENGEIVGHERKRLWAASPLSKAEAKEKAERLEKNAREAEDEFWKREGIRRGTLQPDPAPVPVRPKKRPTLIQCAEESMASRKRYVDGKATGAQYGYRKKQQGYINILLESPLVDEPMDCLALADVVSWFTSKYMPTHEETTSARFKAWLVQVGDWGQRNKYWDDNLFQSLPALSAKAKNKDERVYGLDEIDAMWEAARTPQERALLVLLRCGMRQGECTALAEDQILDGQTVFVNYTLGYEDNSWCQRTPLGKVPKTIPFLHRPKGQSRGKVHIPKVWMSYILEAVDLAQANLIRAHDDETNPHNRNPGHPIHRRFVCCNRYGLCWGDTCVSDALRALMRRAGVDAGNTNQTFHAWRHALASDLLALGCGDMELAYLMRHTDYNMSKSVYASARQEHLASYRKYARNADSPQDYIDALCRFDEDRRTAKRKIAQR